MATIVANSRALGWMPRFKSVLLNPWKELALEVFRNENVA